MSNQHTQARRAGMAWSVSVCSRRGFLGAALAACARGRAQAQQQLGPNNGEVSWLSEVQQAPRLDHDEITPLNPLLKDGLGGAITTQEGWNKRRAEIRNQWLRYLGPLAAAIRELPKIEVLDEDRTAGVVRQLVRYEPESGWATEAYLLRPANIRGPCPGVVVFHSTVNHSIRQPAGVEGRPALAFGLNLARRGYVTFCPRNYLWPTNSTLEAGKEAARFLERHPDCKGMARMIFDARLAVDILAGQPEVDKGRLGAVGHSLGAKEVLYLAALDDRVRVTVSSEGGIGTRFSNWDAPWYLSKEITTPSFRLEHHELLALIAPRPFLLIGGDSADGDQSWPFIAAAMQVYQLYGPSARIGLFNHKLGHAVPPAAERRIYQWFDAYL